VQDDIDSLRRFLDGHAKLAVLTGAGCSTASGIPEYRDDAGSWKHARPVQYGDFVAQDAVRRRYWARSFVGWQRMSAARPNDAHRALARLGADGRLAGLVTQNVDNLHRRAGSRPVIDLHGTLDNVVCLGCSERSPRWARGIQRIPKTSRRRRTDWQRCRTPRDLGGCFSEIATRSSRYESWTSVTVKRTETMFASTRPTAPSWSASGLATWRSGSARVFSAFIDHTL